MIAAAETSGQPSGRPGTVMGAGQPQKQLVDGELLRLTKGKSKLSGDEFEIPNRTLYPARGFGLLCVWVWRRSGASTPIKVSIFAERCYR